MGGTVPEGEKYLTILLPPFSHHLPGSLRRGRKRRGEKREEAGTGHAEKAFFASLSSFHFRPRGSTGKEKRGKRGGGEEEMGTSGCGALGDLTFLLFSLRDHSRKEKKGEGEGKEGRGGRKGGRSENPSITPPACLRERRGRGEEGNVGTV